MKHYSPKTEKTYVGWIKRYILYHDKKHPREMGIREIEVYLSYLATEKSNGGDAESGVQCRVSGHQIIQGQGNGREASASLT